MNANFKTIIMQSNANFCQADLKTSGLGSIQWKMRPSRVTNLFDYSQCFWPNSSIAISNFSQLLQLLPVIKPNGPIFIVVFEEVLVWIQVWLYRWLSIMGGSFDLLRCSFALNRFACFLLHSLNYFFRLNRETTKNYKCFQMNLQHSYNIYSFFAIATYLSIA